MKFKLQTADLVSALVAVTRAIASRPVRPIMEGVLVSASENGVTFAATDGSMSIRTEIPAIAEEIGAVVLPGRLLSDLARRLPGADVSFETDGTTVRVRSGKSRSTLTAQDAKDYPEIPSVSGGHSFSIPAATLKDMIARVAFSTATDESRQILTGIKADVTYNGLTLTALDGFRLATASNSGSYDGEYTAIIPARAMNEVARVLPTDGAADIRVTDGHMEIAFSGVTLTTVLLTGNYPDTSKIVPQSFATECLVNRAEMSDAIDRASLMARDNRNNLIRLTIGTDGIAVSSRADIGSVDETVSAEVVGGQLTISFNSRYLTDVFKAVGEDELTMRFNSPTSPCVITAKGESSLLYLVLPVRTA